jgi:hypothetical protein
VPPEEQDVGSSGELLRHDAALGEAGDPGESIVSAEPAGLVKKRVARTSGASEAPQRNEKEGTRLW